LCLESCSEISRIKGPILRGTRCARGVFPQRAATNLSQVVNFYNQRLQIGLTPEQMEDSDQFPASAVGIALPSAFVCAKKVPP
jgi:hypothetical protein